MDKFPLVWNGKPLGELVAEREALYTWFTARCRLPGEGLWCAWVVGDRGELRLGVLEPMGDRACIRRRFSDRMTAPVGRLLRGELRTACPVPKQEPWQSVSEPDRLFQTRWLREQLGGRSGVLTRLRNGETHVAIPYDKGNSFPLVPLFCFADLQVIQGAACLVFAFDEKARPVFPQPHRENGDRVKKFTVSQKK